MGFNTKNENGLKTTWGECGCDTLRCIHWNNFDMASIPRVAITDSMSEKEIAHFERYNENCENTELLWIELEIQAMEQEERKTRSDAGKRKGLRSYYGHEVMDEIYNPSLNTIVDNQGSTDAIRYDDEEIDPFTTHR